VAGTLTHLNLGKLQYKKWMSDEVAVGYELGVAVGKLRRLKDLALRLSSDGRGYHALTQGLAASGGDRPLPLLWRVGVYSCVEANADLIASLLLPSVRVLVPGGFQRQPALLLLTACALRDVGFKHTVVPSEDDKKLFEGMLRAIAPCCIIGDYHVHWQSHSDWWAVRVGPCWLTYS
jgi:hypothetical protein